MTKPRITPQPELDVPIALNLTPNEIFKACGVGSYFGFLSEEGYLADYEDHMAWCHLVENDRTKYSCCIALIEENRNGKIVAEYCVELQIHFNFVNFSWKTGTSSAEAEYAKNCAHQTFIKACALMGVNVGYHLVTDPSPY